ncbi:MAG: YdaS family helix-turn-helix protein [Patescibacteria group bacterium]
METAIAKACRLAGGQSDLARLLKNSGVSVTPQAVHKWVKNGKTPSDKAVLIARLLKGRVKRTELCPDFPWQKNPDSSTRAAA